MAEIKFHKALRLPSSLNSTHDGVWFTDGIKGSFKIYIVSGGVAVPLNYDDATGNYTAGDGIDITGDEISLKKATDLEIGGTKIWKGTQAQYDAIPTKDADTLYFIEDASDSSKIVTFPINSTKGIVLPNKSGSNPELISPITLFDVCPSVDLDYVDWDITWKVFNRMYKASALGDYNLQLEWSPSRCFELVGETMSDVEYIIGGVGSTDAKLILYYE